MTPKVRNYAFYLPQFHPTVENDEWWGKGFTEWRNVAKATPKVARQQQPRLPADLGFYDLRVPEVRHEQAELARNHGIDGFIYYHYWFEGRRLLNRPFDDLLADPSVDFPFALCWANEDWRRNWDGFSGEILMEQTYSREDHEAHIEWILKAFADPRYIRFEGKPMFLVYRAARIPNVRAMTELWRQRAREAGVGEIYLCRVESDNDELASTPEQLGFDAAVEFGVEWRHLGRGRVQNDVSVFDFRNTAHRITNRTQAPYVRHAGIASGFDNTPRKATGIMLDGASPELYEEWLARTIRREIKNSPNATEIPVFINAWNEWAEGAILEPCAIWGKGFLEAHARGVAAGLDVEKPIGERLEADAAPSLTVAIVTYGDAEATMACLSNALQATESEREVEFVVIDNGSCDETSALLRELGHAIRMIRNETRDIDIIAWLQAARLASSNTVLWLSTDVLLDKAGYEIARRAFDQQPHRAGLRLSIEEGRRSRLSNWIDTDNSIALMVDLGRVRQRTTPDELIESKRVTARRAVSVAGAEKSHTVANRG